MGEQKTVIYLDGFTSCVCSGRAVPNKLCDGELAFEEKGKKVTLSLRSGEEAKALAIDGCVLTDNEPKCDGLFLYRARNNKNFILLVELKGGEIDHAFGQLNYMRNNRPEYTQIKTLFMNNQTGSLREEAFIVSNHGISTVDKQKLENQNQLRVKAILFSEASSPRPDLRDYL